MANSLYIESIRATLGLNQSGDQYWSVQDDDEKENLYLIHYDTTKIATLKNSGIDPLTQSRIMGLRGVIIFLPKGKDGNYLSIGTIVSRGFSYTPTCTVSELFDETADVLELADNNGARHVLNFASDQKLRFTTSFDGCVLRVSKWNNKIIMTTAKKINISKSFWGPSDKFPEIYKSLNGPDPMTLFSKDKIYSNITHLFMLVHPNLSIASRLNVGTGYIVYLGHRENNQPMGDEILSLPDNYETVSHFNLSQPNIHTMKYVDIDGNPCAPYHDPPTEETMGFVVTPTMMTEKQRNIANIIMTVGDSSYSVEDFKDIDQRLTQGESLIVNYTDAHGYGRMIRVSPIAHNWRLAIMSGNFNRYNQFIIDYTYALKQPLDKDRPTPSSSNETDLLRVFDGTPDKVYTYEQLFPSVATPTKEELLQFKEEIATDFNVPASLPDYFTREFKNDTDSMTRNIVACFILAAPPNYVIDVIGFYPRFIADRAAMMSEFLNNFTKYKDIYNTADPRTWGLIDNQENNGPGEKLSQLKLPKTPEGKDAPQPFSKKEKDKYVLNQAGKRIVAIFNQALKYADEALAKGQVIKYPDGKPVARIDILKQNLIVLLDREKGISLYSIMTAVKKYIGERS